MQNTKWPGISRHRGMFEMEQGPAHLNNVRDQRHEHVQALLQLGENVQALLQLSEHEQALLKLGEHEQALLQLGEHEQALPQFGKHEQALPQFDMCYCTSQMIFMSMQVTGNQSDGWATGKVPHKVPVLGDSCQLGPDTTVPCGDCGRIHKVFACLESAVFWSPDTTGRTHRTVSHLIPLEGHRTVSHLTPLEGHTEVRHLTPLNSETPDVSLSKYKSMFLNTCTVGHKVKS